MTSFGTFTLWIFLASPVIPSPEVSAALPEAVEFSTYQSRKDCEEIANQLQDVFEIKGIKHTVKCGPAGVNPFTLK